MECVAAARRGLPVGACPEDYVFRAARARPQSGCRSCSNPDRTHSPSTASCSRATPATTGRAGAGRRPRPPVPVVPLLDQLDGAADHVTRLANLVASPRRRSSACSPSPTSAAGASCGSCPRRGTPTTATTTARRGGPPAADAQRLPPRRREIRHFWASELFYAPAEPARSRATSARSSRCGTSSTSRPRAARPAGTSS